MPHFLLLSAILCVTQWYLNHSCLSRPENALLLVFWWYISGKNRKMIEGRMIIWTKLTTFRQIFCKFIIHSKLIDKVSKMQTKAISAGWKGWVDFALEVYPAPCFLNPVIHKVHIINSKQCLLARLAVSILNKTFYFSLLTLVKPVNAILPYTEELLIEKDVLTCSRH